MFIREPTKIRSLKIQRMALRSPNQQPRCDCMFIFNLTAVGNQSPKVLCLNTAVVNIAPRTLR